MSDDIRSLLVETFNIDLAEIGSAARVALPIGPQQHDMLDLLGQDGAVLCAIPADSAPSMVAIAYDLHAQGMVAGEREAWAKLRALIGAAAG
jgi:hypothetical protein